jgi:hypothetical protein
MSTLVSFDATTATLEGQGARVEAIPGGVRLHCGAAGARLRFEGPAATGHSWPADGILSVDVLHSLPLTLPVQFAFGEPGEDHAVIFANAGVLPHVRTRVMFPLAALNAETVFLPRTPGRLKMVVSGRPTRPERIAWLQVGVGNIGEAGVVELTNLRLLSEPELLAPEGPPVVDELGQWTAKTWPGKTRSVGEMAERLQAAHDAPEVPLPGRTRYGGSTEIHFEPSGYFRTHHDGTRWWLVDPDGGAFFSVGVDCVRPEMECRVEGNESLCEFLPPRDGEYAEAWGDRGTFNWSIANLIRVFGKQWRTAWETLARKWLVNWGFNTVANWSDLGFARRCGLPYVLPLANFPTTPKTVFRDFPDVFSPEYTRSAQAFAQQLQAYVGDRYLIGYFLRNEPLWGFGQFKIAEELLTHAADRAPGCRQQLAQDLSRLYRGSDAAFAEAWGGLVCSFEEIERFVLADACCLTPRASQDLAQFSRKMVDAYVRIPSEACRAVDPDHLNLGIRWAWIASDDLLAGSECFDVFSLNMYQMAPDRETIERAARASSRPVMIGEFHWGARDVGLPSTGLRAVANQAERGKAYRYFVEQGAAIPDLVGMHYFQMNDQPVLGRFDGENFQIGLVDICWRPYDEMVRAALATHRRIYDVACGKVAPFADRPEELPRIGF